MFKKAIISYIVIFVVVLYLVIVALGFTNDIASKRVEFQRLRLSGWDYEQKEIDSNKTKITYKISLVNHDKKGDFIRLVTPEYKEEAENIIEYEDYIVINKEIQPDEKMEIVWDIIVNSNVLKESGNKGIRQFLTSVTVSTANYNTYYTFIP